MKNKLLLISILIIILLCLFLFDKDKNILNKEYDSNYISNSNSIYFYSFKDRIYYIDDIINDYESNNAIYKYSYEIDPRAYTDFRDYYLFKYSVLRSGTFIKKYDCNTNDCYVISRDLESSIMNMNEVMKDRKVNIYDGVIIELYI